MLTVFYMIMALLLGAGGGLLWLAGGALAAGTRKVQRARALYRAELVPESNRKGRFDKTSDPFLDWAGAMGLDSATIEKESAWLQEHYKLTRPDVKSDLDEAMKMIKEVTDGTRTTERKALASGTHLSGEVLPAVREQVPAHGAKEREVRELQGLLWEGALCNCSPADIIDFEGRVVQRIHEAHCASRGFKAGGQAKYTSF